MTLKKIRAVAEVGGGGIFRVLDTLGSLFFSLASPSPSNHPTGAFLRWGGSLGRELNCEARWKLPNPPGFSKTGGFSRNSCGRCGREAASATTFPRSIWGS